MTRHEAEKLLGGYATGTLTDEERQALFAAALEHQELFDALAGEETLRELLSDPVARGRLLALLPAASAHTGFREWLRRPAAIGAAASLAGAAIVGIALWRYTGSAPPRRAEVAQMRQSPPAATPAPRTSAPDPSRAEPAAIAPKQPPLAVTPRPAEAARSAFSETAERPSPPAPSALPRSPAAGVIGGVVGGVPPTPPPAPPQRSAADRASPAVVATRVGEQPVKPDVIQVRPAEAAGALSFKIASLAAQPSYQLRKLEGNTVRLTVTSPAGGNFYLVKRTAEGAAVITAGHTVVGPAGATEAVYEFPLANTVAVDLYVLPQPQANPEALPPKAPAAGSYFRVYPESPANPAIR